MNTATHHYTRGMSQSLSRGIGQSSTTQDINLATTAAQTASAIALQTTSLGPTVATLLGLGTASAAVPVVGAAIAGISLAIEAILNSGCGQTCIETSQWANQAEGYLKQNIAQYFAIAPPRPQSVQQIAVANFTAIWNQLVQLCSQPGLGAAGQNCIGDRAAGACKWKAAAPEYPGEPAQGTCWNWWNAYHDPIANDPNVQASSPLTSAASAVSSAASSLLGGTQGSGGDGSILLIGALVVGGVLLFSSL